MLSLHTQAVAWRWSPHRHGSLRAAAQRPGWAYRQNRSRKRSCFKCMAVAQQGAPSQDEVERQLEESAQAIDEMVNEVTRELLLSAAVAHVTGEAEEATQAQLVKSAVASRLDSLNNTFLPVLSSYVQGAVEAGNQEIAELLLAIHDEVVDSVGQRLPPEMRVLNAALGAASGAERLELMKQQTREGSENETAEGASDGAEGGASAGAGAGQLPRCRLDDLERAVTQLIDEMEAMQEVPDRQLLARLCLVREEVHEMMRERAQFPRLRRRAAGAAAAAGAGGHQQAHPRYADPSFQEAEVVEPASSNSSGTGAQQPQQARKQKKGVPWGKPAQEVEVEVVAAGGSGDAEGSSSGEEEDEWGAAAPQPAQRASESAGGGAGVEEEEGEYGDQGAGAPVLLPFEQAGAVPRSVVAFLKEVMVVNDSEKRRALLEKAFRSDWEGAAPISRQRKGHTQQEDEDEEFYAAQRKLLERLASKGARGEAEERAAALGGNPNLVRPGRFMQALNVLQAELLRQAGEGASVEGQQPGQGQEQQQAASVSEGVLLRMEDVRREALVVLMDIAGEVGSEYRP